jgi:hypothetical protein
LFVAASRRTDGGFGAGRKTAKIASGLPLFAHNFQMEFF